MTYHHLTPKASQRYHPSRVIHGQYYRDSMELLEEPNSFVDALTFSESDGYIGMPMVRAVPSHDIQELYIRKPVLSSYGPQITPQHSRCCFNGSCPHAAEIVYDLKPRIPPHLKISQQRLPNYAARLAASSTCKMETTNANESRVNNIPPLRSVPLISNSKQAQEHGQLGTMDGAAIPYKTSRLRRGSLQTLLGKKVAPLFESLHYEQELSENPKEHSSLSSADRPQISETIDGQERGNCTCRVPPVISNSSCHDFEVKKMNSQGDTEKCEVSKLDAIERMVATFDENEANYLSEDQKKEIKEMSKFLVPRAPKSVTGGPNGIQRSDIAKNPLLPIDATDSKLTQRNSVVSLRQSLDSILDQLENCEISLNAVKSKYSTNISKPNENIFNLREISEKLSKYPDDNCALEGENQETTEYDVSKRSSIESSHPSTPVITSSKYNLDDVSALELHRSKSYIVNLIDRALSKELGTISRERLEKEKFQDFTLSKAVNHIKRNSKMSPKLSLIKEDNNQQLDLIGGKNSNTSFEHDGEPPYIKQLKDLRWGHFRHIQQEVKRLEDLERFLDSCNSFEATD